MLFKWVPLIIQWVVANAATMADVLTILVATATVKLWFVPWVQDRIVLKRQITKLQKELDVCKTGATVLREAAQAKFQTVEILRHELDRYSQEINLQRCMLERRDYIEEYMSELCAKGIISKDEFPKIR